MCLCRYLAASPVESMSVPGAFVTSETATISLTTATIAVMTTAIIAGMTTLDAVMKAAIIDATITLMTAAMIGVVLLSGVAEMIEMIAGGVGPAAGGGIAVQLACLTRSVVYCPTFSTGRDANLILRQSNLTLRRAVVGGGDAA